MAALLPLIVAAGSTPAFAQALPTVTVTANSPITEGQDAVFTLTRTGETTAVLPDVAFDITVTGRGVVSSATSSSLPTSVEFAIGNNTATVTIPTVADSTDEDDGEITLELDATATNVMVGDPANAAVVVQDDDDEPTLTIVATQAAVVEGGDLIFTVTPTPTSGKEITATFSVAGSGTNPAAAADFTQPASTTLIIPAYDVSGMITVATFQDTIDEPNEEIEVTLLASPSPTNALLPANPSATGTITDNDTPTVAVGNAGTAPEGEDLVFEVTVTPRSYKEIVIGYTLSGTGINATDFNDPKVSQLSGTLRIPADTGTMNLALTTAIDGEDEQPETVTLSLVAGDGYAVSATAGEDSATGKIALGPVIVVTNSDGTTIEDGATADLDLMTHFGAVPLISTAGVDQTVSRIFTIHNRGDEVLNLSGNVTLSERGRSRNAFWFSITDQPDRVIAIGGRSSFEITFNPRSSGNYARAWVDIASNDVNHPPSENGFDFQVFGAKGEARISVKDSNDRTVVRNREIDLGRVLIDSSPMDLTYTVSNPGTADLALGELEIEGDDFTIVSQPDSLVEATNPDSSTTFTIRYTPVKGVSEATVTLPVINAETVPSDPMRQGRRLFDIRLKGQGINEATPATGDVTISGGSAIGDVLTANTSEIADDVNGLSSPSFTYTWQRGTSAFDTSPENITGADSIAYQLAAADLNGYVRLRVTFADDDGYTETKESDYIGSIEAAAGPPPPLPTVTVVAVYGAVDESDPVRFVLTRTGDTTNTLGTTFAVTGGDNVLSGTLPTTATFPANSNTVEVSIPTAEDAVNEAEATVTLTLMNVATYNLGAAATQSARVTVRDNDLPVLSIENVTVAEDAGTAQFTVTATPASYQTISVIYTLTGGTATVDEDYTNPTVARERTVVFVAGDTVEMFTVAIANDSVDEPDETFTVALGNVAPEGSAVVAGSRRGSATGTITDNDVPEISIAPATAVEGSPVTFEITVSPASIEDIEVVYTLADGSAVAGTDYTNPPDDESRTAMIPASIGTVEIEVDTLQNAADGPDKTFMIALGTPTSDGDVTVAADAGTATGTITDDEVPELAIANSSAAEGSPVTFTVSVTPATHQELMVVYTLATGTATAGTDFASPSAPALRTFTIPANAESQTFDVATDTDTTDEGNETFTVTLDSVTPLDGASIPSDGRETATGTIHDVQTPLVTVADASAAEGSEITFTISVSPPSANELSVVYSLEDDTAAGGTDFTNPSAVSARTVTIPANAATQAFTVATADDSADEPDETFTVMLESVTPSTNVNIAAESGRRATGTITDNDVPLLSIGDASATEGSSISFEVTVTPASHQDIEVAYLLTDETATANTDYTVPANANDRMIMIPAGDTTYNVTVETMDDEIDEADETFRVILDTVTPSGAAEVAGSAGGTATGTIADDDVPVISFEDAAEFSAVEGSPVTFAVTVSPVSRQDIMFVYTLAEGTATEGDDFVNPADIAGRTITIPASTARHTFDVATVQDDVDEPSETFAISLGTVTPQGSASVDASGGSAATGTINDDDVPEISIADAAATEGESITFTVTADRASHQDFTFVYVLDSQDTGSATRGVDYQSPAAVSDRRVTFPANMTRHTFTVNTIDDDLGENIESFPILLDSVLPHGSAVISGTEASALGSINDDDTPLITITDAENTEGLAIRFTVSVSPTADDVLSVTYRLTDDTTMVGDDYTAPASFTFPIPANMPSATFDIMTRDDSIDEADETFDIELVRVSPSTAANIAAGDGGEAKGTIIDNDVPALSITHASAVEGMAISFEVSVGPASHQPISVTYTLTDMTATAGDDYTSPASVQTLEIPAGDQTFEFTVETTDDSADEPDETFEVALGTVTPAGAATVAAGTATGTIEDNDVPVVSIENSTAVEGSLLTFTLTVEPPSFQDIMVVYTLADEEAVEGADYTNPSTVSDRTITIPQNATTHTLVVETLQDNEGEPIETFTVALDEIVVEGSATIAAAAAGGTAIGTINDDDRSLISIAHSSATEGSPMTFSLTVAPPNDTEDLVVMYTLVDDSATAGEDYVNPSTSEERTITIPAGATAFDLVIETIQDNADEPNETFEVVLDSVTPDTSANIAAGDAGRATGTINDDEAPVVSIANASAAEGTDITFTVTVSPPSSQDLTVAYSLADSLTNGAADYSSPATPEERMLMIPAGTPSQPLTFATVQDTEPERHETFRVTLVSVTPSTAASIDADGGDTATGIIYDDDRPTVSIEDASATEGSAVTFTVTLSQASSTPIMVLFQLGENSDDTAEGGEDYTVPSTEIERTVIIPVGDTTTQIVVETISDEANEADETFTVTLGAVSPTTAANVAPGEGGMATGTIEDDDVPVLSIADSSAEEGMEIEFTVTATPPSYQPIMVVYTLTGDSATEGDDFTNPPTVQERTITIPEGVDGTQTFTVVTIQDDMDEGDETFTVTLSDPAPSGAATIATDGSGDATGTIENDDALVITVRNAPAVVEGEDLEFEVIVDPVRAAPIDLTYVLSGNGINAADFDEAGAGGDLNNLSGTLTIDANTANATISLTTVADSEDEDEETVTLTLTGGGIEVMAEGVIRDGDLPEVTVADADPVTEGEDLVFAVTVDRTDGPAFEVTYNLSGDGIEAADFADTDLVALSGTLEIDEDATSAEIRLTTADDSVVESNEMVRLDLASGGVGNASGTINDNDSLMPMIGDATEVAEGEDLVFEVTISPVSAVDVDLTYTLEGTGITAEDFDDSDVSGLSGTLTIPARDAMARIEITTAMDDTDELDEMVTLTLTGGITGSASGTILDGDTPVVSVQTATAVVEGGDLIFEVTVTPASIVEIDLEYTLSGDDITEADFDDGDLTMLMGELSILAGEGSSAITLTTSMDEDEEGEEMVTLELTSGGSGSATGVIRDASLPTVTVADAIAVTEGEDLVFTVTVAPPSEDAIDLTYVLDGDGITGDDFADSEITALTGMFTVPEDTENATITLTTRDDSISEQTETVRLRLTSGGVGSATGDILDNDSLLVSIADAATVTEGGNLEFAVSLSQANNERITVDYSFSGTAAEGDDYTDQTAGAGTLIFEAGNVARTLTIRLATLQDNLDEDDEETVIVTLSNVVSGGAARLSQSAMSATGSITDGDDPMFALTLERSRREGNQQILDFEVQLAPVSLMQISVDYELGGDAEYGVDYTCAIFEVDGEGEESADSDSDCPDLANGSSARDAAVARSASAAGSDQGSQDDPMGMLVFEPREGTKIIRLTVSSSQDGTAPPESIIVTLGTVTPSGAAEVDENADAVTASIGFSILEELARDGAITMLHHHVSRFESVVSDAALARLRGHRTADLEAAGVDGVDSIRAALRLNGDQIASGWSGWGSLGYGSVSGRGDGSAFDIYTGMDVASPTGSSVFGLLVGYESGDLELGDSDTIEADYSSSHVQFGLYAGTRTQGGIVLDGAVAMGSGSPSIETETVSADLSTQRLTAKAGISGRLGGQDGLFSFEPTAGLLYVTETVDSFTDSAGRIAEENTLGITRLSAGIRLSASFGGGQFVLHPKFNYDSEDLGDAKEGEEDEDDTSGSGVSTSLQGALRYNLQSGSIMQFSGGFNGIGNSDIYQSFTFSGNFTIPF